MPHPVTITERKKIIVKKWLNNLPFETSELKEGQVMHFFSFFTLLKKIHFFDNDLYPFYKIGLTDKAGGAAEGINKDSFIKLF